jgi:hypothetical protein
VNVKLTRDFRLWKSPEARTCRIAASDFKTDFIHWCWEFHLKHTVYFPRITAALFETRLHFLPTKLITAQRGHTWWIPPGGETRAAQTPFCPSPGGKFARQL